MNTLVSVSPSSDSGSSSRSDWFRQSVLFWSSQSERSDCSNSVIEEDAATASIISDDFEENTLCESPLKEVVSESLESLPEILDHEERSPPQVFDNEEDEMDNDKPKRNIVDEFDPSELLRQVEELERCFTKSQSELSAVDDTTTSSGTGSPHLTLEFPTGSSIKENPLFKNDRRMRRMNKQVIETKGVEEIVDDDAKDDLSIIESIQEVNNTLSEISREIELSSALSRSIEEEEDEEAKEDQIEVERETNVFAAENEDTSGVINEQPSPEEIVPTDLSHDVDDDDDDVNRDPNTVMRDWLSNIRPPPSPPLSERLPVVAEKECEQGVVVQDQQIPQSIDDDIISRSSDDMICQEVALPEQQIQLDARKLVYKDISEQEAVGELSIENEPLLAEETIYQEELSQPSSSELSSDIPKRVAPKQNHPVTHEELFEKIDQLINFERQDSDNNPLQLSNRSSHSKHSTRERLDSGLQSVSSDSTSPYQSPNIKRSLQMKYPRANTIHEVLHESMTPATADHVFRDDSDFSDWSPISTLESNYRGSLPRGSSNKSRPDWSPISTLDSNYRGHSNRNIKSRPDWSPVSTLESSCRGSLPRTNNNNNKNRSRSHSISYSKPMHFSNGTCDMNDQQQQQHVRSQSVTHERETIEKFLALTNQYLDKDGVSSLKSTISIDDIAIIPSLRETIHQQRMELENQRKKQEEFLHQLGDLLLEVVTIKEEHTTVRTKQTKALNLLKKQLDAHKKTQTQAHTDVVSRVKSLDEKINTSFSSDPIAHSPVSPATNNKFIYTDPQNGGTHKGHIIWKVSDVMKKLARVKTGCMEGTVVGPAFQTGEYGYRMNSWLYLNGRGKMAGRYLSLYVCVLVGDYDPILKWPIKPSYTMTLIDQNGDLIKRKDHVKVRRVIDIAGRGANVISEYGGIPRPSDSTKALIVGFDDFISHEHLLERRYLSSDTLFIKIEASIS